MTAATSKKGFCRNMITHCLHSQHSGNIGCIFGSFAICNIKLQNWLFYTLCYKIKDFLTQFLLFSSRFFYKNTKYLIIISNGLFFSDFFFLLIVHLPSFSFILIIWRILEAFFRQFACSCPIWQSPTFLPFYDTKNTQ